MSYDVNNELERLLGPRTPSNRTARRLFKRLMTRHWPLTPAPDPVLHPRLCIFVQQYEARIRATVAP
jgi:hypothetical protein